MACVREFGTCDGSGCCPPLRCFRQSVWYAQCGTACPLHARPAWDCASALLPPPVKATGFHEEEQPLPSSTTPAEQQAIRTRLASCQPSLPSPSSPSLVLYLRLPRVGNGLMCALLSACSSYASRGACGADSRVGVGCLLSGSPTYNQYGNYKLSSSSLGMCAGPNGTSAECSSGGGEAGAVCAGLQAMRLPATALVQYESFPLFDKPPCVWASAPVRLIALLRDPAERAQSAFTYGLEQCVCNFKFSWCTAYSSFRYKNRVHHLCEGHRPKVSFYQATSVLHGHHGVVFNPTSTDGEHEKGRTETSTLIARLTLAHCVAWVGIADDWDISLRLLQLEMPDIFSRLDVQHPSLQWRSPPPDEASPEAKARSAGNRSHPYLRSHLLADDFAIYDSEKSRLYRRARKAGLLVPLSSFTP
ncbi:MAG: hypothetical protein SGPRY_010854 [Prymnesium sp.]